MSDELPLISDEEAGEHLAKLRELRKDLCNKSMLFRVAKRKLKDAKDEMDGAEFDLLEYLGNLNKSMPLFDGRAEAEDEEADDDDETVDVDAELAAGCAEVEAARAAEAEPDKTDETPPKRGGKPKPAPEPIAETPGEDGLFLVFEGRQKRPTHAIRAGSKLEAIYHAKASHPAEARLRIEPDDGTAKRLGLAIMTATAPVAPACTHCKGKPDTICPVCGRVGKPTPAARKPRRRKGDAEARP